MSFNPLMVEPVRQSDSEELEKEGIYKQCKM